MKMYLSYIITTKETFMSMNIISISNTTQGSVNPRTQEYEADRDRSGKVIYSAERFKVVTTPDSTMPSQLTATQISKLIQFATDNGTSVSVKAGVNYELSRSDSRDSSTNPNGVTLQPAVLWYFRPEKPPMGEFKF